MYTFSILGDREDPLLSRGAGVLGDPIQTRWADFVQHITTGPPRFSDDAASLLASYNEAVIVDWGNPMPTSTMNVNEVLGNPTSAGTVNEVLGNPGSAGTVNEVWGNRELPEVPENQLGSIDPFAGELEAEPTIRFLPSKNVQKVRKYSFHKYVHAGLGGGHNMPTRLVRAPSDF